MKCPYIRKSETHVHGFIQNFCEDEDKARGVHIDQWAFQQSDCLQE